MSTGPQLFSIMLLPLYTYSASKSHRSFHFFLGEGMRKTVTIDTSQQSAILILGYSD